VIIRRSVAIAALLSVSALANAAPFTPGNLVVERVGTGAAALTSAATSVFLDEFNTTGALQQSLGMSVVASGTASSEGMINRSADGGMLMVPGYVAATGTAGIANTSATAAPRAANVVAAYGSVLRTPTAGTLLGGNNVRSAASAHTTDIYLGGAGGLAYLNYNTGTATPINSANVRDLNVTNDTLYFSTASTSQVGTGTGTGTTSGVAPTGIYSMGGLPTAGSLSATLIAASASPYAFLFADLNAAIGGVDTLYVADDSTTANGGGIRKYSKQANGSWSFNSVLATATAVRGLTGSVANGQVQLFATSETKLYGVTDTAGYNANLTGTLSTLATAGTNTVFRGVTMAPAVPEPETYGLALVGLALVGGLRLRRR
jgi:hypothetical protein